jgi:hypothetical protein
MEGDVAMIEFYAVPRRRLTPTRLLVAGWILALVPSNFDIGWFFALLPLVAMAALTVATRVWLRQLEQQRQQDEWDYEVALMQQQAELTAAALARTTNRGF